MSLRLSGILAAIAIAFGASTSANAGQILFTPIGGTNTILFAAPVGQSFVAEDALVNAGLFFTVVNPQSGNGDDLVYDLYEGAGTGGTLLASLTFSLADDFSGFQLLDFSATPLIVGDTYSLVVSVDGTSTYWAVNATTDAPAGTGVIFGNLSSFDQFALLVDPIAEVPAPMSIGLLGFALTGLGYARRKGVAGR